MNQAILIFNLICALIFVGCSQSPKQKAYMLYQKGDYQKALPLLESLCIKGDISSCKLTAILYGKKTQTKAILALEYACKYGDTLSCKIATQGYSQLKLPNKAFQTLQYGCQGGNATLCFSLAKQYFLQKNPTQSRRYAIKSCYGGNKDSCLFAIYLLEQFNDEAQIKNLRKKYDLLLQS